MRTFPISPQTVMSATCQPSLEPAVPLASVAPATCPSSQRDPGDASGITHTQLYLCLIAHVHLSQKQIIKLYVINWLFSDIVVL